MRISVVHSTTYRYSSPVFLEPHIIRLRPREDGSQRLVTFSLAIDPAPAGIALALDAEGNSVSHAWFVSPISTLTVRSAFQLDTLRENPFDFLAGPGDRALPLRYPSSVQAALSAYINVPASQALSEFAAAIAARSGYRTLDFLSTLNQALFERTRHVERLEGEPLPPEVTLAAREGSCRDLAVLFCALCRNMGIAARFVSGYESQTAVLATGGHLHAWAEVYFDGGGWRGYDPSRGLAASLAHIPVAAAAHPAAAAPITGAFRGDATAAIEYAVSMQLA